MKIPPKNRPEWQELLTGQLNVPLKNFFFQMKITQAKSQVAHHKISLEEAVDELYSLCVKFSKAKYMDTDMENIFGSPSKVIDNTKEDITEQETYNKSYTFSHKEDEKKNENDDLENQKRIEKLERIKLEEERAKQKIDLETNHHSNPSQINKIDKIKLEAQRAIQQRYEMELAKQRAKDHQNKAMKLENATTTANAIPKSKLEKREAEKSKLAKRKVYKKKKSGFGSFIRSWFN